MQRKESANRGAQAGDRMMMVGMETHGNKKFKRCVGSGIEGLGN